MVSTRVIAFAAVTLAVVLIGTYALFAFQSLTTTTSSTSQSSTSTVSSTSCTTTTSSTVTTTTVSSTSSSSSSVANGSFTYLPSSPVKVESVIAATNTDRNGTGYVTFAVAFENVGAAPIYVMGGCGGGLDSSVQTSTVIQKVSGGPLCACPQFISSLSPGQNHTSSNPGCWSGYRYELVQPGTVTVNLTLHWWLTDGNSGGANSTSILATFTFA